MERKRLQPGGMEQKSLPCHPAHSHSCHSFPVPTFQPTLWPPPLLPNIHPPCAPLDICLLILGRLTSRRRIPPVLLNIDHPSDPPCCPNPVHPSKPGPNWNPRTYPSLLSQTPPSRLSLLHLPKPSIHHQSASSEIRSPNPAIILASVST